VLYSRSHGWCSGSASAAAAFAAGCIPLAVACAVQLKQRTSSITNMLPLSLWFCSAAIPCCHISWMARWCIHHTHFPGTPPTWGGT